MFAVAAAALVLFVCAADDPPALLGEDVTHHGGHSRELQGLPELQLLLSEGQRASLALHAAVCFDFPVDPRDLAFTEQPLSSPAVPPGAEPEAALQEEGEGEEQREAQRRSHRRTVRQDGYYVWFFMHGG